jgi:hypothetical protein
MIGTITADLVEAYSLCPRKAFLLMAGESKPEPHECVRMTDEQAAANRQACRVRLAVDGLHARCDFLTKMTEPSRLGRYSYEPVKVIGTCRAARADAPGLACQGFVLGEVQGRLPASGTLVLLGDRPSKVKLAAKYREVRRIVEALRVWAKAPAGEAPSVSC